MTEKTIPSEKRLKKLNVPLRSGKYSDKEGVGAINSKPYQGTGTFPMQSIRSYEKHGITPILEISGKSMSRLGVSLSAFNLLLKTPNGRKMTVVCAYQGSKVFENGGPYHELYSVPSRAVKTDDRLRNSGVLIAFNFCGEEFPTEPKTAFYDWLYMNALYQKKRDFVKELEAYQGFSDIVFNPNRSINCQARAAALFVSLSKNGLIDEQILQDKDRYLALITGKKEPLPTEPTPHQLTLPLQ